MNKLKLVIFIDDDDAINYYHEYVVKKIELFEKYIFFQQAENALAYLSNIGEADVIPELIFLDINMPKMDGWTFLEAYRKLAISGIPVVILTTSTSPRDHDLAKQNELVYKIVNKPLTKKRLLELIHEIFNDYSEEE